MKLGHLKAALYIGVLEETHAHTGPGSACSVKTYKSLHARLISEAFFTAMPVSKDWKKWFFFQIYSFQQMTIR